MHRSSDKRAPHISRRGIGALAGALATTAAVRPAAATEREFSSNAARPARRPNILVVIGDDLGWSDLGCYGATHIRTPNLDRLAAQGVRFSQGYSTGAVCSPTRMALYTGRYPARTPGGLAEPITEKRREVGLRPDHPTLASLLGDDGYTTAMFGKWHCGFLPWFGPLKSGWQEFFGSYAGAVDYHSKVTSRAEHDLYEGEEPVDVPGYYTDIITDRAVEFLRRPHDKPWLLNVNFTAVHWPWERRGDTDVSRELTQRARDGESGALAHRDGGSVEIYAEMVETLDESVGRILDTLRSTGQHNDTLVLFFSDNGGERFSHTWPLFNGKGTLHEGGIRVPSILRWPAAIDPNQVSHVPVATQDWTATLLEIAGVPPAPNYPLDGTSLAGYLLRGEAPPEHDLFWRTRKYRALRRGRWKYLRGPESNAREVETLHDLSTDPRERSNVARHHPEILDALRTRWEDINSGLLPYNRIDS